MNDDIDALLAAAPLAPPLDFAARLTALAQATPQARQSSRTIRPWQRVSLGAVAGLCAWQLCEFVFVAFIAVGAK